MRELMEKHPDLKADFAQHIEEEKIRVEKAKMRAQHEEETNLWATREKRRMTVESVTELVLRHSGAEEEICLSRFGELLLQQ